MQSIKSISLYCDNLCEVELFPEDVEELTISDIGTDIAIRRRVQDDRYLRSRIHDYQA